MDFRALSCVSTTEGGLERSAIYKRDSYKVAEDEISHWFAMCLQFETALMII